MRVEGACLWAGDPPNTRKAGGEECASSSECASALCLTVEHDGVPRSECAELCVDDSHCPAGRKCGVVPRPSSVSGAPAISGDFPTSYLGVCGPAGAGAECTGNATCPAGHQCVPFEAFTAGFTSVAIRSACRPVPNAAGAGVGAPCSSNAECRSGRCATNALTGLGYCTAYCLGGEPDCGGGTSCRALAFDARDPATVADDLRVGECVETGLGFSCRTAPACLVCSGDLDCSPAQDVRCVKPVPAAATGFCRDRFGRCLDPCRHGCVEGDPASCPAGSSCTRAQLNQTEETTYCANAQTGQCVGADLPKALHYEHGMCGDPEYPLGGGPRASQQDLCYYYGRQSVGGTQTDLFTCGTACDTGTPCSSIPVAGNGSQGTVCRTVYEFGVPVGGSLVGGAAMSPPQCAPPSAFVGQNPP